jgi:hypothetical protein
MQCRGTRPARAVGRRRFDCLLTGTPTPSRLHKEAIMVVLGVILALIGLLAGLSVLLWIGIILVIVGLVLNVSGRAAPYGARWY